MRRAAPLLALGLLASCAAPPAPPRLDLTPASFADLPGWREDGVAEVLPAFLKSCADIAKRGDDAALGPAGGKAGDWRGACAEASSLAGADDETARKFFERNFAPYAATDRGNGTALLTGYYEPLLKGARHRGGIYVTPLLRRPPDLVSVDLGLFRPSWRGERTAGRVENGRLVPYASRAEIEAGALDRFKLDLVWVDDPVAAFFLQIQGSGRVALEDGGTIHLGYDGENGRTYVSIGRLLVDQGAMTLDQVSAQSIKAWLASHPDAAKDLMDRNPSYVFFREQTGDGPLGTEGVALTPGRSLAVDREFIALGIPVFLDIAQDGQQPTRRLTVAQDTGAAIRGPLRGDLFWGFGSEAESRAGVMRAQGRIYLLLPRPAPEKP
ncbi:MAG TPA: murein transglycosylase A [Stellaceae bacterium]|nr:murein transglycosylase A [Stellaceae bacterium]